MMGSTGIPRRRWHHAVILVGSLVLLAFGFSYLRDQDLQLDRVPVYLWLFAVPIVGQVLFGLWARWVATRAYFRIGSGQIQVKTVALKSPVVLEYGYSQVKAVGLYQGTPVLLLVNGEHVPLPMLHGFYTFRNRQITEAISLEIGVPYSGVLEHSEIGDMVGATGEVVLSRFGADNKLLPEERRKVLKLVIPVVLLSVGLRVALAIWGN